MRNRQLIAAALMLAATFAITTFAYFQLRSEWITFYHAEKLYNAKEFAAAIPYYKEAMDKGLQTRKLYYHLGDAYTSTKQFDAAAQLYNNYLARDPDDSEARLRLARVLSYSGNLEASSKEYEKVVNHPAKEGHEAKPK